MPDGLKFLFMAVGCFILASATHEAGHLFAGLRQGFQFQWFVAGPLGIRRDENGRIVLYLERNPSLWGGLAATAPRHESEGNYRRFGRILLGGPLASIILGSCGVVLGTVAESRFALMFGAMSVGLGVVSMIPMRNGAFYTDGGRYLRMNRDGRARQEEVALWSLTQQALVRGSYGHSGTAEIEILKQSEDARMRFLGHYYSYCYNRDNGADTAMEEERLALGELSTEVPRQMIQMFPVD